MNRKWLLAGIPLIILLLWHFYPSTIYTEGDIPDSDWAQDQSLEILFIGDSIVHGTAANKPYSEILSERFEAEGFEHLEIYNESRNGATSKDVLGWMPLIFQQYEPDICLIAVGWNDRKNKISVEDFSGNIDKISAMLHRKGIHCIFISSTLVSIPFANQAIKPYNKVLKNKAEENEFGFFDMYACWKEEIGRSELRKHIAADSVHPNSRGQQFMADQLWIHLFQNYINN